MLGATIKYRKRRSARVWGFNPWNFDIEVGDLLIDKDGKLYRARQHRNRNRRDAGELTAVEIKPPGPGFVARMSPDRREVFWVKVK
jgi:hypothetical protein